MSEENKEVAEITEEVEEKNIDPVIICQFTFHPATGDITFEMARDLDMIDLLKCKRMLCEQVEDAEVNLQNLLYRQQQQIMHKQNATLEGLRELLKGKLASVSKKSKE